MKKKRAISAGEVLWDVFGEDARIGGAPFNVAAHFRRLGGESAIFTCLGADARGRDALAAIERLGVRTDFVLTHPALPTGAAYVTLDAKGNAQYDLPPAAYDALPMDEGILQRLRAFKPDALVVGTLAQRTREGADAVKALLAAQIAPHVLFDVNIRLGFMPKDIIQRTLCQSTLFKLNEQECALLGPLLFSAPLSPEAFAQRVLGEYGVKAVVVTMGDAGAYVASEGISRRVSGQPVKVADTVGAGDAFSAAFLHTYLTTLDPIAAAEAGNALGAQTAGHKGAIPET